MISGKLKARLLPAVLVMLLAAAQQAGATILRAVPLEEQARGAELVVVAVAGVQSCSWGEGGQRIIYTDTRFRVERWVKGTGGAEVTTRRLGGVIGDIGQSVPGSPEFRSGRRYVLFLESAGSGRYRVVGFSQGAYPVVSSTRGGSRVMPSLAAASGVPVIGVAEGGAISAQPLEEFLARVQAILGKGGKQ